MSEKIPKNSEIEIPDDLRIVQLEGENVKRLYAAAISPTDELTKIGGWNENGKSSLIDCVSYTLCGGRALPVEPLRRGAKKGRSALKIESRESDFGLTAERRFTKKGDTLVIKFDGQDEPVKSPQELANRFYNASAAQPDDFLLKGSKEQVEILRKTVGIDFTDLDAQASALYEERKGVNREIKLLEGQVAGAEYYDDVQAVDVASIQQQLKAAAEHNESVESHKRDSERRAMQIDNLTEQASQCDAEIELLRKRAVELKEKAATLWAQAAELASAEMTKAPEPIDTSELLTQLSEAEETNRKVTANERKRELEKELRAKNSESTKLTLALERIDETKSEQLAKARFPVPGLSFSDDGVLLNGIPFEQASQEQQVITAAAIALAQQPKLKAILMRRGSLLDPQHQAALRQWAKDNKCQVFLEVVGKDADCEFIIENGMVAEKDEWE